MYQMHVPNGFLAEQIINTANMANILANSSFSYVQNYVETLAFILNAVLNSLSFKFPPNSESNIWPLNAALCSLAHC